MIPESSIVNVSVSVSQAANAAAGFGLTCIFGSSATLPIGARFMLASGMTDVEAIYDSGSPEFGAAQVFFSRSPKPTQLMIARVFSAAVAAELLGGANPTKLLSTYTAITNGALSVVVDGTPVAITAVDLHLAASLAGVAGIIQTALAAAESGMTCVYQNGQFIVRSGTTGTLSTIAYPTTPGSGTNLAPLLALRSADGAVTTQGAASETIAQALANVNAIKQDWQFLMLVTSPSDADNEAAAAFALANQKVCGYTSSAGTCVTSGNTTDIGSVLQATGNGRVFGIFDLSGTNPYAVASAFAEASTVDFEGEDTAETLMFKKLAGVTVSNISTTQKATLDGKNLNYYVSVGGNPMLMKGVMADGTYFDQVQGLDWLSSSIGAAVFAGVYGSRKVPQTNKGMATILHWIEVVLQQGVRCGLLAPGVWNAAGIGEINTGDRLAKGFYSWAASIDDQSQEVRNTRQAPPITILAKGAGALQGFNIAINFEE